MKISGQLVDIHKRNIYPAELSIAKGRISEIQRIDSAPELFILPGLIDSHIHIESSMVTPGSFAEAAVRHGTCAVVSDPHEIANVLGKRGVEFMIDDARMVPLKFWFGAPSCVPATSFESNGAVLDVDEVKNLLERPDIKYLSEMMNFPGVIYNDSEVMSKIRAAAKLGKPVDGHAPGLTGIELKKYISAGISTDHECSSIEEAREKLELGMKILIREGSAARNLNALKDLFLTNAPGIMLCSDDLHPEMLVKRHINKLIAGLISEGYDIFDVIRSATINPVEHYKLDSGLLRIGENADFIIVDSLHEMNVKETWIEGKKVFENGKVLFSYSPGKALNKFNCSSINVNDIRVLNLKKDYRVITAFEGELLTGEIHCSPGAGKFVESNINTDILKIVVKDRYKDLPAATGFIKGFNLKAGAFASSVAHDSHNIIAIGTNDDDIAGCINKVIEIKGGLAVTYGDKVKSLRLDIGGIMTTRPCVETAQEYEALNSFVQELGCSMKSPFMTLSFMALLVIPDLKIGDRGLFDVKKFQPVPLFV
jgi:adenine deaminase